MEINPLCRGRRQDQGFRTSAWLISAATASTPRAQARSMPRWELISEHYFVPYRV